MYILGIETSCDDTAVSVAKFDVNEKDSDKFEIISEEISSQNSIHVDYGGVLPELAAREHLKVLPFIIDSVLLKASIKIEDISLIGVTTGPGLKGSLIIGSTFAESLAFMLGIPVFGINHIEGHMLSPMISNSQLNFPFVSLVVSGGHTEFSLVHDFGCYELLCRTVDDAAGEAFDKSANLLDIPYPGGKQLSELADTVKSSHYKLPIPAKGLEILSYSGFKTAVSLLVKKEKEKGINQDDKSRLCFSIQDAIIQSLIIKVKKISQKYNIKNFGISGGVSANSELRKRLGLLEGINVYFPSLMHCSDNASMIAFVAFKYFSDSKNNLFHGKNVALQVIPNLKIENSTFKKISSQ